MTHIQNLSRRRHGAGRHPLYLHRTAASVEANNGVISLLGLSTLSLSFLPSHFQTSSPKGNESGKGHHPTVAKQADGGAGGAGVRDSISMVVAAAAGRSF
ncbi:hypothetical protein NL676_023150 [Syzygium grande]|nr:hypothetical protein NL676_023150 [Syzygium grande]